MEDFLNQIYLRGYLESGNLILNGIIHVRELDWKEANESVVLREDRHFNLVRDLHSLIESGMLIDFTFIVSGREMEVHKAILAGLSNYPCELLNYDDFFFSSLASLRANVQR